jgi:hypothetical protein
MRTPIAAPLAVAALLSLAALGAGCGSGDEEPPASAASQTTTSSPGLAGTYERTLTRADIERTEELRDESGPGQEKPKPARLELTLGRGTLTLADAGAGAGAGVTIRQDFSATSDGAFRIGAYQAPEQGSFCGPDVSQTASYTWERSGDVLTLEAEHDECADRDSVLSGDWKRR